MCGNVLDAGERLVDGEHVGDGLCALHLEVIPADTVNASQIEASAGPDGRERACSGVLDARKRVVDLEGLCHVLSKLRTHPVLGQAANRGRTEASAGPDDREKGEHTHLSLTRTEFCLRSYASSMASPTLRPWPEKSASVWSDLKPQSVVSCGLPCATSIMAFAPSSPMSFRSKLPIRVEWRRQRVLTAKASKFEWHHT